MSNPPADGDPVDRNVLRYVRDSRRRSAVEALEAAHADLHVLFGKVVAGRGTPGELLGLSQRIADAAAQLTAVHTLDTLINDR